MIGNLIGAAIGRSIDRRDGKGGTAGAVLGVAAAMGVRRILPLAVLVGGAYLAKNAITGAINRRGSGSTPTA